MTLLNWDEASVPAEFVILLLLFRVRSTIGALVVPLAAAETFPPDPMVMSDPPAAIVAVWSGVVEAVTVVDCVIVVDVAHAAFAAKQSGASATAAISLFRIREELIRSLGWGVFIVR